MNNNSKQKDIEILIKDAISSSNLPTKTNYKADVIKIQTGAFSVIIIMTVWLHCSNPLHLSIIYLSS